ncbi:MAG: helix-turn-helix transcriptional regulator [Paracoccaceae bacterium]
MVGSKIAPSQIDAQESVRALMGLVGRRVHFLRKGAGYSRRELSELSGVSNRYLAQLEGGEGNISIGLLQQIALALETSIDALVLQERQGDAESAHVASLYQKADKAARARVMQVLDPIAARAAKANRICLIGLRGAGKSTLGALIASDLAIPFIELNTEIEAQVGVPVREIIALYGEEGYRQIEADTLTTIIQEHDQIVLAVAGGIVASAQAFERVLLNFHTIWIKAQPAEHMERVRAQGDLRPMAGNPQAMDQLRQILRTREEHYAKAAYQLDTSGKPIQTSRAELNALLQTHNVVKSTPI